MAASARVSVCIPTHNRAEYLARSMRSVLDQTFGDFELIISDNASTDKTTQTVRSFGDRRIRYEPSAANAGSRENWNRCVALAETPYIAILHDDDWYEPAFLEQAVGFLDQNPGTGFVYSGAYLVDKDGRRTGCLRLSPSNRLWRHPALAFRFLKRNHDVVFSSVLARREAYRQAGRFDPELLCADYEIWLKMAFLYDIGCLAQPLVSYRTHEASTTASMSPQRFVEENRLIVNRVIDWAKTRTPGAESFRLSALHAVDHVWAFRSLQTTWKLLAEQQVEPARICLKEARRLQAGWPTAFLLQGTRLCLNGAGFVIARMVQRIRRSLRTMGRGMSVS